jgi:hypothetical protein
MFSTKVVDIGRVFYPKKPYYFDYLLKIKQVVNPQNKELIGLYGGAGADMQTALLSTNCSQFIFVNDVGYGFSAENVLDYFARQTFSAEYTQEVFSHGFCIWSLIETPGMLLSAMGAELNHLGVSLADVTAINTDGGVQIDFSWRHPATETTRPYSVKFFSGDITNPGTYSSHLQQALNQGFDIYFQKAGMSIPASYSTFLPYLDAQMNAHGFFITDDMGRHPEDPEPDRYRREPYYRTFSFPLTTVVDVPIPGFERKDFYKRPSWLCRQSDDDLYGSWLNVRQKTDFLQ